MNAEYDKGYQNGYDAGYKRAMLDYGLEDDKPCEDAVSRNSLLSKLDPCYKEKKGIVPDNLAEGFMQVEKLIKTEPPVTPKPRTGKWEMPQKDDGMSDPIYYQVRCSKCGFDLDPQTWYMELHQYGGDKYCPRCGARMEGESE